MSATPGISDSSASTFAVSIKPSTVAESFGHRCSHVWVGLEGRVYLSFTPSSVAVLVGVEVDG